MIKQVSELNDEDAEQRKLSIKEIADWMTKEGVFKLLWCKTTHTELIRKSGDIFQTLAKE